MCVKPVQNDVRMSDEMYRRQPMLRVQTIKCGKC
jgi:hypothetical protein